MMPRRSSNALIAFVLLYPWLQASPVVGFQAPRRLHRHRTELSFSLFNGQTDGDRNNIQQISVYPPDHDPRKSIQEKFGLVNPFDLESFFEVLVPLVTPVVAFMSYEWIASAFDLVVEALSDKNWVAVDGGAYQAKIIAPVTNGVVVPAIAVLFATLTSTTIGTLRTRQVDIRKAINMEAGEIRVLETLISSYPSNEIKQKCRHYVVQYCTRIIAESQPSFSPEDNDVVNTGGTDSELYGLIGQLNAAGDAIPPQLAAETYASISRLREQRYNRISSLQSTYPPMHFAILAILAVAECTGFLMEANQELLVFLNAVQLKLLWSMLVWCFVACFTVFYDLRSPFSGGYQISGSVDQLYTVRDALLADERLTELELTKIDK